MHKALAKSSANESFFFALKSKALAAKNTNAMKNENLDVASNSWIKANRELNMAESIEFQ